MSSFVLKIIALFSMFCDHFGRVLSKGELSFMNYIGRIAFPIFAFQISEGYAHTKDLKKYFIKLFTFALISQIPFNLFQYAFGYDFTFNIMFTLILGLSAITLWDKLPNKLLGALGVIICIFLGNVFPVDYGYWGVLLIFCFYLFRNNKLLMSIIFFLLILARYGNNIIYSNFYYPYLLLSLSTFLSIVPILMYNGKQGIKTKYGLYIFYPLHLLILALFYLL